jgi:UDP-N-acetylglucosamine--N-acetylmuramyl-(pentapeptide) pyrophosphoryl-undecaprenol N-acetylglucosamine transferase
MTPPRANRIHVAIACGGTGGHLFPGLAVAEQLQARNCSVAVLISPKEVDQQAVKAVRDLEVVTLPAVAFQRGSRLAFLRGYWQSRRAADRLFKTRRPAAVLAMGGFTSAPPVLAARGCRAKTFLHESNTIPGRANRWLARLVNCAFVGFPQAESRLAAREIVVTGTPVRPQFQPRDLAVCREALGLDPARPVVLVTGGSQGASGINEMILTSLPMLVRHTLQWQWLHLSGQNDLQRVKQTYAKLGLKAVVHPFLAEMELALGAATACVSRAGASSLAELAAVRLPALLVPFPQAADNHQFHNARAFDESGAGKLLEQGEATPEKVSALLRGLVEDVSVREKMKTALAGWHEPKAAEQIAELILRKVTQNADHPAGGSIVDSPRACSPSRAGLESSSLA